MSEFEPTPAIHTTDTPPVNAVLTDEQIALVKREAESAGVKLPESSEEIGKFWMQCALGSRENDL